MKLELVENGSILNIELSNGKHLSMSEEFLMQLADVRDEMKHRSPGLGRPSFDVYEYIKNQEKMILKEGIRC
ncbi:MAG: hypothetical protein K0Q47_22 [Sedimentibacter sp.]|jgi:hypothetical protein|nr:hypothetical protein [Sedimentibacter sp.]